MMRAASIYLKTYAGSSNIQSDRNASDGPVSMLSLPIAFAGDDERCVVCDVTLIVGEAVTWADPDNQEHGMVCSASCYDNAARLRGDVVEGDAPMDVDELREWYETRSTMDPPPAGTPAEAVRKLAEEFSGEADSLQEQADDLCDQASDLRRIAESMRPKKIAPNGPITGVYLRRVAGE